MQKNTDHNFNENIINAIDCRDGKTITCGGQPEGQLGNDGRLITVAEESNPENSTHFFRATMNVCVKGIDDCPRDDSRQNNMQDPYLLLHGLVHTCDGTLKHEKCVVYPASGQTVQELYAEVMAILSSGECWIVE